MTACISCVDIIAGSHGRGYLVQREFRTKPKQAIVCHQLMHLYADVAIPPIFFKLFKINFRVKCQIYSYILMTWSFSNPLQMNALYL